jgi:hypothetical protein
VVTGGIARKQTAQLCERDDLQSDHVRFAASFNGRAFLKNDRLFFGSKRRKNCVPYAMISGDCAARVKPVEHVAKSNSLVLTEFAASRILMRTRSNDRTEIGSVCARSSEETLRQGSSG